MKERERGCYGNDVAIAPRDAISTAEEGANGFKEPSDLRIHGSVEEEGRRKSRDRWGILRILFLGFWLGIGIGTGIGIGIGIWIVFFFFFLS